ncbi:MAG: DoxX family protein [Ferruginibacter sp.]
MTNNNKNIGWYNPHPLMFTLTRLILGSMLAIRGVYFFINIEPLYYLIKDSRLNELNISMCLAMVISFIHILGGVFIFIGLFTKIAAWAQVPILLGAIIFINSHNRLLFTFSGLLFSLGVLALLLIFAFKGGGKISLDDYAKKDLL